MAEFLEDVDHHPRNFGTFARKIGHYAIEERILPLAQAIRSATGLPADIFGIPERGYLRAGYWADIVVFDPAQYRDRATFDKPQEYAAGVRYVFLAGQTAVDDSKPNPQMFGKALRHPVVTSSISGGLLNAKEISPSLAHRLVFGHRIAFPRRRHPSESTTRQSKQ